MGDQVSKLLLHLLLAGLQCRELGRLLLLDPAHLLLMILHINQPSSGCVLKMCLLSPDCSDQEASGFRAALVSV